jgi:hypothetical protein
MATHCPPALATIPTATNTAISDQSTDIADRRGGRTPEGIAVEVLIDPRLRTAPTTTGRKNRSYVLLTVSAFQSPAGESASRRGRRRRRGSRGRARRRRAQSVNNCASERRSTARCWERTAETGWSDQNRSTA